MRTECAMATLVGLGTKAEVDSEQVTGLKSEVSRASGSSYMGGIREDGGAGREATSRDFQIIHIHHDGQDQPTLASSTTCPC